MVERVSSLLKYYVMYTRRACHRGRKIDYCLYMLISIHTQLIQHFYGNTMNFY